MSAAETPQSVWEYTENAPEYAHAIAYLWGWSLNYGLNDPRSPFPLFLDLVGYSSDRFGERVSGFTQTTDQLRRVGYNGDEFGLGWLELDLLAQALSEYADRPRDCDEWLDGLHACEG